MTAPATDAATRPAGRSRQPRNNAARLFGYDVFISFALGSPPRGTLSYASDLARKLRERDFTVFFSEDEAPPGNQLDGTLKQGLKRSRMLVVIANRGTLADPRWVRVEVEEFRRLHPEGPIVPISIGGAVQDATLAGAVREWLRFEDRIWIDDTQAAGEEGVVSDGVVARLATAPRAAHASSRWRWTVRAAFCTLAGLTAAALWFSWSDRQNARAALAGRLAAESQLSRTWDPALAMLLAAHAYGIEPIASAKAALLTGLGTHPRLSAQLASFTDADGRNAPVGALAFSPDGATLAAGTRDGRLVLVDMAARKAFGETMTAPTEWLRQLVFSPDGKLLASVAHKPYAARLWDVRTRALRAELPTNNKDYPIEAIAFDPRGGEAATAGADLLVWDLASHRLKATLFNDADRPYGHLAYAPDGGRIYAQIWGGKLDAWDPKRGERVGQWPLSDVQSTLNDGFAIGPDGGRLVMAGIDYALMQWDLRQGRPEPNPLVGHTGTTTDLAFSDDGNVIASAGMDGSVRLWRTGSVEIRYGAPLLAHRGGVTAVAFAPKSHRLATGGVDGRVYLWDIDALPFVARRLRPAGEAVMAIAHGPDGRTLAISQKNAVELWDPGRGERVQRMDNAHASDVEALAFAPDGRTLASVAAREVALWRLVAGRFVPGPRRALPAHATTVAFFGPAGPLAVQDSDGIGTYRVDDLQPLSRAASPARRPFQKMAAWPRRNALVFWRTEGRLDMVGPDLSPQSGTARLPTLSNAPISFAPSPRDDTFGAVLQGVTDTVRLWNAATGAELRPPLQGDSFHHIGLTGDGSMLMGMDSHVFSLWDYATRTSIGELPGGHVRGLTALSMHPTVPAAVTGGWDGEVLLWDLDAAHWRDRACRTANRNLSCTEWRQHMGTAPYEVTCPEFPPAGRCE